MNHVNYLLGFCLLCLGTLLHAASQDKVTYQIKPSQNKFVVTLKSNPTTGYQWLIKQYDKSLLTLTASHYVSSNTQLMGASGQILFNFSIKAGLPRPKKTLIQFVYRKPWEPNTGTVKTITVNFSE